MSNDVILQTRGLTKEFKGFVAVDKVNLRVQRGTIHALIGPNGAGKTTCFNLLTKFIAPTAGQILFNGIDITGEAPARIARRGIIRSFQISAVFPHLSVLENVRYGLVVSGLAKPAADERARATLATVGLTGFDARLPSELSGGQQQRVALARALVLEPAVLLFDEPTQGMGLEDVDRIRQLIKKVAANRTVLMVEHNMSVVASIADTITVLQRGATLAEGPYEQVSKNPAVIEAYMGSADAELKGAH